MVKFKRLDLKQEIHKRHGANLPHWRQDRATYAITNRLYDSLPADVVQRYQFERNHIIQTAKQLNRGLSIQEQRRLDRLFSERIEAYLDAGQGDCWLARPEIAQIVKDAIFHFEGRRYAIIAWCIMPNHWHVMLQPIPPHELSQILHSWNSFSAKQCNKLLGRTGTFWQGEPYDHIVRDEEDYYNQVQYILNNPASAQLRAWPWVGLGRGAM
ncbi:transposase [Candidatus Sumerlaeota bacterium]|nr:transposase [Candidatus Sumerlaeota bacterium]